MSRPKNVTTLACLQFFYSGYTLLLNLATLLIEPFREGLVKLLSQAPSSESVQISAGIMQGLMMVNARVGIFSAIIGFLLGYGLLKLKRWAWICTFISQLFIILGFLLSLISLKSMPWSIAVQSFFHLILAITIIHYLFRQDVEQAFHR